MLLIFIQFCRPLSILQTRIISKNNQEIKQFLIQWSGLSISEATWEDMERLQLDFPTFNLEDKVNFNGGGIDGIEEWGEATEDVSKVKMEEQELERVNLEDYNSGRPKRLIRRPVRWLA